tara:strand:+ start:4321 stop:6288 length:1968 start_codon:yes stop_codon:yes gene_type:complete
MRIYTEVNFQWDDKKGKLVEVSSESFDYSGEMALCKKTVIRNYYWDAAGNKYMHQYDLKKNPIRADESYFYSWTGSAWKQEYHKGKQHLGKSKHEEWGKDHAKKFAGLTDQTVHTSWASAETQWKKDFHNIAMPTDQKSSFAAYKRYTDGTEEWIEDLKSYEAVTTLEDDPLWTKGDDGEWTFTQDQEVVGLVQEVIDAGGYEEEYDLDEDGDVDAADLINLKKASLGGQADTRKMSADVLKRHAESTLKSHMDNWKDLIDPSEEHDIQTSAEEFVKLMEFDEADVETAYADLFKVGGTLENIQTTWKDDVAKAEAKYLTDLGILEDIETEGLLVLQTPYEQLAGGFDEAGDWQIGSMEEEHDIAIGEYGTAQEKGLEGTDISREEGMESLRGEAKQTIREAEAKIGASGFASTGVGKTARELLAAEIGGAARDIDKGITRERTGIREGYLTDVGTETTRYTGAKANLLEDYNINKKIVTDRFDTDEAALADVYGEGGSIYDDYIEARDAAAKDALGTTTSGWRGESKTYKEGRALLGGKEAGARSAFKTELGTIGGYIEETITGITDTIGAEEAWDPNWNPFATGSYLKDLGYGARTDYGLSSDFIFTMPEVDADAFYNTYEDPEWLDTADDKLYDADAILPWEAGYIPYTEAT